MAETNPAVREILSEQGVGTETNPAVESILGANSDATAEFMQWAASHGLTGEDFGAQAAPGRFLQWAFAHGLTAKDFPQPAGGGASGAGGGGGTGPAPAGAPALSDADLEQRIRDDYPAFAWLLDDPEIRALLFSAEREQWSDSVFQARLAATNWWKTHSPSVRQWDTLERLDPAAASQRLGQRSAELWDAARRMGLPASADTIAGFARQSLRFGMNDAQMQDLLVSHLRFASEPRGQLGADMASVKRLGAQYLTRVSDQTAFRMARQIAAGETTLEGLVSDFRRQAKSRYSWMADQIDRGTTPEEFFEPIRQDVAATLEISPAQIDFLQPRWSRVTETRDSKGRMRPMTRAEAMEWARSQPEYRHTRQGQQSQAELALFLGEQLGVHA